MNGYAFMILGFVALLSRWQLLLAAGRAWRGISESHPEFAKALYTSGLDQAFYGIGPLYWTPLFRWPVPDDLRVTVRKMRVATVVHGVLGCAFLAYFAAFIFHTLRGG